MYRICRKVINFNYSLLNSEELSETLGILDPLPYCTFPKTDPVEFFYLEFANALCPPVVASYSKYYKFGRYMFLMHHSRVGYIFPNAVVGSVKGGIKSPFKTRSVKGTSS